MDENVINGKFLNEWSDSKYSYFFNVVLTGEEKHGDYTLVMTKTPHRGRKYGIKREVTKEFVNDPNFIDYVKATTQNIKYPE